MLQAKRRALQQTAARYVQEKAIYENIQKRRKRGLYRRLVAYGILTMVFSATFISIYAAQNETMEEKITEKERLQHELATAEETRKELEIEIKKLHDPEYIGEIARRDFFLSKEGETIFKLPADHSTN